MNTYRLVHRPSGREVAVVTKADSWWAKGWGVLGRRELPRGQGIWLPGVASVHTVGVRFALDVLFLDDEFKTVKSVPNVPPGRVWVGAHRAAQTLELGAGTLASLGLTVGIGEDWRLERVVLPPC